MEVVVNLTSRSLNPREISPVPVTYGIGGSVAPEPVWIFWGREKFLPLARFQTRDHPAHSLVAIVAHHAFRTFFVIVAIL